MVNRNDKSGCFDGADLPSFEDEVRCTERSLTHGIFVFYHSISKARRLAQTIQRRYFKYHTPAGIVCAPFLW